MDRIGQTLPTAVHHFVVGETVEENVAMLYKKRVRFSILSLFTHASLSVPPPGGEVARRLGSDVVRVRVSRGQREGGCRWNVERDESGYVQVQGTALRRRWAGP